MKATGTGIEPVKPAKSADLPHYKWAAPLVLLLTLFAPALQAVTLSVEGSRFLLNGQPTFLLGMSYYAGTGAPVEYVRRDLQDLRRRGFNWVRVWATWNAFGHDVSAVDSNGEARQPYMNRLLALVREANRQGLVGDVSLTRGKPEGSLTAISTQTAHLKAVETLAKALKPYRNVYFDLSNERNIGDARYTSFEDLRELRDRVKSVDPKRQVTASSGGDISQEEVEKYLITAKLDFLTPHRPREKDAISQTQAKTEAYLEGMKSLGQVVPLLYQEPFRRGYPFDGGEIGVNDYLRDVTAACRGGAAGWCLHNGEERTGKEGRPRRSFDLRREEGRLFDQLDAVEKEAADRLSRQIRRPFTGLRLNRLNSLLSF